MMGIHWFDFVILFFMLAVLAGIVFLLLAVVRGRTD